jgi:hypothetical protein
MTIEQFLWAVPFVALGIALVLLAIVLLAKPRKRADPQNSRRS